MYFQGLQGKTNSANTSIVQGNEEANASVKEFVTFLTQNVR